MSAKLIHVNKYALIPRDHSLVHVTLGMSYKKMGHLVKVTITMKADTVIINYLSQTLTSASKRLLLYRICASISVTQNV